MNLYELREKGQRTWEGFCVAWQEWRGGGRFRSHRAQKGTGPCLLGDSLLFVFSGSFFIFIQNKSAAIP